MIFDVFVEVILLVNIKYYKFMFSYFSLKKHNCWVIVLITLRILITKSIRNVFVLYGSSRSSLFVRWTNDLPHPHWPTCLPFKYLNYNFNINAPWKSRLQGIKVVHFKVNIQLVFKIAILYFVFFFNLSMKCIIFINLVFITHAHVFFYTFIRNNFIS